MSDTTKFPKLLKEFSLDPECFSTLEEFLRIIQGLGVSEGRYVAEIPTDKWLGLLKEALVRKFPTESIRVKAELENLKRCNGVLPTRKNVSTNWLEATLLEDQILPFAGIITTNSLVPQRWPPRELSTRKDPWRREPGTLVKKRRDELAKLASQIFRIGKEIKIVDPYFHPGEKRYLDSFEQIIREAAYCQESYDRFELHCLLNHSTVKLKKRDNPRFDESTWIEEFRQACYASLAKKMPRRFSVKIMIWERNFRGETMHARYIMCEYIAIKFDYGLDESEHENTTDVDLVPPDVHRVRWKQFQQRSRDFRLAKMLELVGTGKPIRGN